ncbi:GIY-YIG nuclease family protein [Mesonia sp. HuA40]|uniref:GIY-YIG nuclease family protein n=1 Tax=Mesonia sp. HuA40 TaxID=2602761 RepID=UPI0011CA9376|nr:GIY-YIG nuclease family protein [Mesonia sp. HuA40]TXK74100.1 GIY-YIG nuclease family protein [Mesonia sp. HuA40]
MRLYYVYILACNDNSYYTGITSDIKKRMIEHNTACEPKAYTAKRLPVQLVYLTSFTEVNLAIAKEKQIKIWSRRKKIALINSEFNDLRNLSKKKFE